LLTHSATADELKNNHDNGDQEQDVYESSNRGPSQEAENPKDGKNDSNGIQHDRFPFG